MKKIYSHHNPMLVGLVQSHLEQASISVLLKNDIAAGGAGELAPIDLWPELWLNNENDYKRASDILTKLNQSTGETWHCQRCEEENEASFEICWRCNTPLIAPATAN